MKLSSYKSNTYRVAPIPVKAKENGQEIETVLNVKYRPLDRAWFNSYEQVQRKINRLRTDGIALAGKLDETENRLLDLKTGLSALLIGSDEAKSLQSEIEAQTKVAEDGQKELKEFMEQASSLQQNLMAEQLLPVLIDLDLTDDEDKPLEITLDLLTGLDYELLYDIGDFIAKKTFRNQTG